MVLDWRFVVDIKITEIPLLGSQWMSRLLERWRLVASSWFMGNRIRMLGRQGHGYCLGYPGGCPIERWAKEPGMATKFWHQSWLGYYIVSRVVLRVIFVIFEHQLHNPSKLSWLALSRSVKRTSGHGDVLDICLEWYEERKKARKKSLLYYNAPHPHEMEFEKQTKWVYCSR